MLEQVAPYANDAFVSTSAASVNEINYRATPPHNERKRKLSAAESQVASGSSAEELTYQSLSDQINNQHLLPTSEEPILRPITLEWQDIETAAPNGSRTKITAYKVSKHITLLK